LGTKTEPITLVSVTVLQRFNRWLPGTKFFRGVKTDWILNFNILQDLVWLVGHNYPLLKGLAPEVPMTLIGQIFRFEHLLGQVANHQGNGLTDDFWIYMKCIVRT
jgi:hypothetical protein